WEAAAALIVARAARPASRCRSHLWLVPARLKKKRTRPPAECPQHISCLPPGANDSPDYFILPALTVHHKFAVACILCMQPLARERIFMRVLGILASLSLIFFTLLDGFEAILQPRRVTHRYRYVRLYYRAMWMVWGAASKLFPAGKTRLAFLSVFGPLSLLGL